MNRYSEIHVALDFAVKYDALYVTIETDDGKQDLDPREAEELFDNLSAGESFALLSIHFSTDN